MVISFEEKDRVAIEAKGITVIEFKRILYKTEKSIEHAWRVLEECGNVIVKAWNVFAERFAEAVDSVEMILEVIKDSLQEAVVRFDRGVSMNVRKEELRPCVVKIGELPRTVRNATGECSREVLKEAEIHKGYFHTWANEQYVTNGYLVGTVAGQMSSLYGVVEYEDGTVHRIDPECIIFTDRQ